MSRLPGLPGGLRACVRNGPEPVRAAPKPLFKSFSASERVRRGGGGRRCPGPGAGPAQPIWGRRDVSGAPGAGSGPGRAPVPRGGRRARGPGLGASKIPARYRERCRPARCQGAGQRTCTSATAGPSCSVLMEVRL